MAPNEFINQNYEKLLSASKKISGNHQLAEEALHYSILDFLGKKNVNAIVDSGGGTFYIIAILIKCFRSRTSNFYRTNLEHKPELTNNLDYSDEVDNTQEQYNLACAALEKLHWYDKKLFLLYAEENCNISKLSRATGIPRTSITLSIKRIRKYLQEALQQS